MWSCQSGLTEIQMQCGRFPDEEVCILTLLLQLALHSLLMYHLSNTALVLVMASV